MTKNITIGLLGLLLAGLVGCVYFKAKPSASTDSVIIIADGGDAGFSRGAVGASGGSGTGIHFFHNQAWGASGNTWVATIVDTSSWSVSEPKANDSEVLNNGPGVLVSTTANSAPPVSVTDYEYFTVGPGCTQSSIDPKTIYCSGSESISDLYIPKAHTKTGKEDHKPNNGIFKISPN